MNSKQALALIQAERKEQIEKHGYTIVRDRGTYFIGDLLDAAEQIHNHKLKWAWVRGIYNKKTLQQRLIIAGAFCLAENEVFGHNPDADDLLQTIIAELTEL